MNDQNRISVGPARFSLLTPHLLRLEYTPYDDRPSMRALTRPDPIAFTEVSTDGAQTVLRGEHLTVRYRPGDSFDAANLAVEWQVGGMHNTWKPGAPDLHNLGGTVFSLDNINGHLIPEGVHPADLNEAALEASVLFNPWHFLELVWRDLWMRYGGAYPRRVALTSALVREHWSDLSDKTRQEIERWRRYTPGILSRSGYFLLNDSQTARLDQGWRADPQAPGGQDWYLFVYGRDYTRALKDFVTLCGPVPMLPRWAFGIWYSYWDDVGEEEQRRRVAAFEEHDLPLDVYVMDMQWHYPSHWCGFDWHPDLFPEPAKLLAWFHEKGLHVPLNLHFAGIPLDAQALPAIAADLGKDIQPKLASYTRPPSNTPSNKVSFSEADLFTYDLGDKPQAEAVLKHLIAPLYGDGVDFFWLDGQNGTTPGMNNQLWTNHLFYTDAARRFPGRRPLILSRYGGIGSHRYPVGFSGDTFADWDTLRYEVEMTARAGNVGQVYWSHDLGGHMHPFDTSPIGMPTDPELYLRWVQFGALSPITRLHATFGCVREPWAYGPLILAAMRKALQLRISLMPYFYHLAHQAHESGLPLCRPLYLHYPQDGAAYEHGDEYLLGDRLLIAPVTTSGGLRHVYVPEDCWWSWLPVGSHAASPESLFVGPLSLTALARHDEIPVYARAGTLLPRQPVSRRVGTRVPERLIVEVYPNAPGQAARDSLNLYEDDGESMAYRAGDYSTLPLHLAADDRTITVAAEPIQGSYPGVPDRREFEVQIRFVEAPRTVELNGRPLSQPDWAWEAADQTLLIHLGQQHVHAGWQVRVHR